jgi:hypothetical protein
MALAVTLVTVTAAAAHGGGGGGHGGHYVVVGVSSSVAVVPRAKTGDYSQIHKIAIVSAVGQTMILGHSGLLAQHSTLDIADWKLDDLVETAIRKYFTGAYTFVDVPHDRAALAAIPNGTMDFSSNEAMRTWIATLPAQGVDAFMVVRPDAEDGTPNTPGLSLGDAYTPGRQAFSANYEIDIIDARTHMVIAHAFSRVALRQGAGAQFAALLGPVDLKLEPGDTPTDIQRQRMQKEFSHVLSISLIETLRSLSLGVVLPPPGARVMVPIPVEINPIKAIKTVAIVSAVGGDLDLNHRAPFFVHDRTAVYVTELGLDGVIEDQIRAALDKRLVVKQIPADRAKVAAMNIPLNADGLATPIDGLTQTKDVDAYIVVLKRASQYGLLNDDVSGLGISHNTNMDGEFTSVFASYEIAIVDAHTMLPIWIAPGHASPARLDVRPGQVVDNATWPPKGANALTPDQGRTVKQALTDVMADSIPETLMHLALTGMMPSGELPPAPLQAAAQ